MLLVVSIRDEKLPRPLTGMYDKILLLKDSLESLLSTLKERYSSVNLIFTTKTGETLSEDKIFNILERDGFIYVWRTSKGPSIRPCALVIRISIAKILEDFWGV